jgi:Ca2+-binding EF-hand superfamily protein
VGLFAKQTRAYGASILFRAIALTTGLLLETFMKRTHASAASALTFALLAHFGVALAQTPPPPKADGGRHEHMRASWQQADLDKDGQLTKAEAQAAGMKHLSDNFDAIDANKDGKVSEAEVTTWLKGKPHQRQAEKPAPAGSAANTQSRPTPENRDGGMGYKTPEQRQADMKERFAKADTNKDGGLSKAELQAAGSHRLLERFDAIDTNKDGKITPEEMRAAWERRQ